VTSANRAVQVTVRHPAYPLTFARLAGQNVWNVQASAVAGLVLPGKYALLALKLDDHFDKGIRPNGGGAKVEVGDVGTNTTSSKHQGCVELRPGSSTTSTRVD
jgi:hypothetical protein